MPMFDFFMAPEEPVLSSVSCGRKQKGVNAACGCKMRSHTCDTGERYQHGGAESVT